jgi:hypothetical protein
VPYVVKNNTFKVKRQRKLRILRVKTTMYDLNKDYVERPGSGREEWSKGMGMKVLVTQISRWSNSMAM